MPEGKSLLNVRTFHLSNQYRQKPPYYPGDPADGLEGQFMLSAESNHKAVCKGKLRFRKADIAAACFRPQPPSGDPFRCRGKQEFF